MATAVTVGGLVINLSANTNQLAADMSQGARTVDASAKTMSRSMDGVADASGRTTNASARLSRQLRDEISAFGMSGQGMQRYRESLSATSDQARAHERAVDSSTRAHQEQSGATLVLGNALRTLAGAYAALKIGAYINDATLLAARYETLGIVMHTAGENAGYSNAQMDAYAKGLEKSGISMMKAREAMISMTTAGLDNTKSLELGRLAQNLAVVANKSSSETLTDLITNIQQADTEGLKHMGIILNQDEALQKYAASHGTVAKALTQTQKAEAVQAAVMQQGAKYAGIYEKAMGTAGKALSSLDRYFENIKVRLGTPFLEGFAQGVFGVTDGVKQLNTWLEQLESNGAMEKVAKSIGSSVGTVISAIKGTIEVTGQIAGSIVNVGKVSAEFFDKYLGGMATIKAVTIGFALLLSGFMVEQAVIGFSALSVAAWASAGKVGAAFLTMSAAAANMVRALTLSAALVGWGPAIALAGRAAVAAIGTVIAGIPGAVGAAVVAAGLGVGYVFAKTFGDTIQKMVPKSVDDAVTKAMAWVVAKTSSLPEVSEAVERDKPEDVAKAAANKLEKDRKEQAMRDMNKSVVDAERQISIVSAANTRLKALNEARDQQLKQSLDLRLITQADYLQKKEKMDVAEVQGQLDQIAAQKAQLATYMAASAAGAPLGQGRDPSADANEMIKLTGEASAAQTKLNAVKQSYASQIAGALIESYTKEFGSVSSLVDAQEELVRASRLAYAVAGKTAEQQEIYSATRMQSMAKELSAEMERRQQNGDATKEYLDSTGAMVEALEQMGGARLKALGKGVAASFLNDTKQMADETIALYDTMKNTFIGDEEERIKAAAAASIKLASIRLADANTAIDKTNDTDGQKLDAKRKAMEDYNTYVKAVYDNADAKVLQSSRGFQALGAAIESAFNVNRIESFGQAMASAFGNAGTALGGLVDTLTQYDQQQRDNEDARKTASVQYKDDATKLAAAQSAITMKQEREQLAYYGNVAGAAKGFFKENSTGYKVMEGVEKTYRAFELALAIQNTLRKTGLLTAYTTASIAGKEAETQAALSSVAPEVTASLLKGQAAAQAGVATQALGEPTTAWARMAAMAAVMVGLGFAVSGSGAGDTTAADRQKANGTGSILGDSDAKSESIKKSLDMVEKNTYQGLTINTSMLSVLRSIDNGVNGVSNMLFRTDGFSTKAAETQLGSAASIGKQMGSLFPFLSAIPGGIVSKIGNAIFGGNVHTVDTGVTLEKGTLAQILAGGANVNQYADTKTDGGLFRKDKTGTAFTSLGDEIDAQFTLLFGSMHDAILQSAAILGMSGDAFNNKLDSFVVDIGKISTKDMKPEEVQTALQNAISKAGDDMAKFAVDGLQQFQNAGEGALETLTRLASEYQTVDVVFDSFGKTFDLVGMSSLGARDRLVQLAGGLDKFTSQGEYFLKNFFSEQEQAAALKKRIAPTLAQYGLSTEGANASNMFRDFVVGLDATTESGAQAYTTLMTIAPAFKQIVDAASSAVDDIASERKSLLDQMDELTMTSAQLLAKQRAAIGESNRLLFDQVQAAKGVQDARTALNAAYQQEQQNITTLRDRMQSLSSTWTKLLADLKLGSSSPLTPQQKYLEAKTQYEQTLAAAKAGDKTAQDNYETVTKAFLDASRTANASSAAYTSDFNMVQAGLTDAAAWASQQVDVAKASLDALNLQVAGLIDINTSVLSVRDALSALGAAMLKASSIGAPLPSSTTIEGLYQTILGRKADDAGLAYWQGVQSQGFSMGDIANMISQGNEYQSSKIDDLYESLLGRHADAAGSSYWLDAMTKGATLSDIESRIKDSNEYQSLNSGTTYSVPSIPAPSASQSTSSSSGITSAQADALIKEVASLRKEQQAQADAQVIATLDGAGLTASAVSQGAAQGAATAAYQARNTEAIA